MSRAVPVLSTRLARRYSQRIGAAPAQVFELLCPERETEWLPGWTYRMIHSATGLAEPGAVFATPNPAQAPDTTREVIWVTVDHVAPERVRFVRWHPDEMVVDIDVRVAAAGARASTVDIAYTYTATSAAGARRIAGMHETQWLEQMQTWESEMNAWFEAQRR